MKEKNIIILRYGELHLKGKNRGVFEKKLIDNIKSYIKDIDCKLIIYRGRYEIIDYSSDCEKEILHRLANIFGIHSYSIARSCDSNIEFIFKTVATVYDGKSTFKIETNRADKNFQLTSLEVSRKIGGLLLSKYKTVKVDLHNPEITINIDIRENGKTYIYTSAVKALGGLPYGTSGKGLVMLSGGIDSPVASFLMAKRGLKIDAVHFWSHPYTSEKAKQKVIDLKNILSKYCPDICLHIVPFTDIQEAIRDNVESNYMITIIRRVMMNIMEQLSINMNASCIVNGECLGQVASQTLESMLVTNSVVKSLPVFRPLVGYDKQNIIDLALKIGTYNTSILPYEDCCTIFMPAKPVIKPTIERVLLNESKIINLNYLINDAIDRTYKCID